MAAKTTRAIVYTRSTAPMDSNTRKNTRIEVQQICP
jgi:hypothetical protein